MEGREVNFVWVFKAQGSRLPNAVFPTKESAEEWIGKLGLSGLLTRYPVGISAYDWSVSNGFFKPSKPHHYEPEFIGKFTGGEVHFHYENGVTGVSPD
jgi:hypothetical protein